MVGLSSPMLTARLSTQPSARTGPRCHGSELPQPASTTGTMPRPALPLSATWRSRAKKSDEVLPMESHHLATPWILLLAVTILPRTRELHTALVGGITCSKASGRRVYLQGTPLLLSQAARLRRTLLQDGLPHLDSPAHHVNGPMPSPPAPGDAARSGSHGYDHNSHNANWWSTSLQMRPEGRETDLLP